MKRRGFIFVMLLFLASAVSLAGSAFAKYRAGKSTPLPVSVEIRRTGIPEGPDYLYDGSSYGISYDSDKIDAEGVTEALDSGNYTAVFSLKDPVTECWEDGSREDKTVTWKIVPRPVVLQSESAVKSWDGTPLQDAGYLLSPGRLPEGPFANVPEGTEVMPEALAEGDTLESVSVTGAQTDAGSSANTIQDARITGPDGQDVTANYDISYVEGLLTVEPVPIDLPENAVYKWNGTEKEISFRAIQGALSEASPGGVTVLDADGNDITASLTVGTYFDGTAQYRLFGAGAWNQHWTYRMTLKPDGNHFWSVPLLGEVTDARTVTLEILPELGNAKDVIIAADNFSMVDGFSASGFAGLLRAPIIAVTRGAESLNSEELDTIHRLTSREGARFWLMGGTGAVSSGIEAELNAMTADPSSHVLAVHRIQGINRLSTAWHILECGLGTDDRIPETWNENGTVIILPGGNVEPTLSIMTYAYATRTPVLLSWRGELMDYQNDKDGDGIQETNIPALDMLRAAGFTKAIIIGPESGTGSTYTSASCEAQLRTANPDIQIMRITGDSIGILSNAMCNWMESSSAASLTDPNILCSGRYSYIHPEAVPAMKDSGRVVSLSDYAGVLKEIDVLGNARLYVRTSAQLPYRYVLTMTDGDQEGNPVLHGWMSDASTGDVFFGDANGSPLQSFRPDAPEGYVLIGFGAPWKNDYYSYVGGVLRMSLEDSYLIAVGENSRQGILYALYVEEGKSALDPGNYVRFKGGTAGGSYQKTLVSAADCRLVVPVE